MERRGRQGWNAYQGGRTRQPYGKPPRGSWQQTVPSWEKKFCYSVGSVTWRKLLDTKKFIDIYGDIVDWNDSAAEEAFQNAKNRFYANYHGIACDIPLPDPDMYIDEVDWDSKIHPDVILDLESGNAPPDAVNKEVIIFGSEFLERHGFSCSPTGWGDNEANQPTGWGDNEVEVKKATNTTLENNALQWDSSEGKNYGGAEGNGWVDYANNNYTWGQEVNNGVNNGWVDYANTNYAWGQEVNNGVNNGWVDYANNNYTWGQEVNNGWEYGGWNNSWDWNQYGFNSYVVDNVSRGNGRGWGGANKGRREGYGRYMSKYRASRSHGHDDNRNHYSWRKGNGNGRGHWRKPMNMNATPGQVGHQWS